MIKFITLLTLFVSSITYGADVKISSLPLGSGSTTGINDSFPYVDSSTMVTKRLTLYDLVNVQRLQRACFQAFHIAGAMLVCLVL